MSRLAIVLAVLSLAACGHSEPVASPDAPDAAHPTPAKTTLTPPPGPFNGEVSVAVTTDVPATVYFTTDGTDPRTSATRQSGNAPLAVTLKQTTALTWYSVTPEGGEEAVASGQYTRAGGPAGSVSGTVVVGDLAAGHLIGLTVDGTTVPLQKLTATGEVPFTITDLATGTHRLLAFSDRNDDERYLPTQDLASDPETIQLDLADPFKASAEGVKLYLAASKPGLCTMRGTVTFTRPVANLNLAVSPMTPDAINAATDPTSLLGLLTSGFQVQTNATDTSYPYVITNLEPGTYLPVASISSIGTAVSLNLVVNPLAQKTMAAGDESVVDFEYGSVALNGTVTVTTTAPPTGLVWGVVAARNLSLRTRTMQALIMPTFFVPGATSLKGSFSGQALRDNESFDLRVFTSDGGANPLVSALPWALNPFAPEAAQATVRAVPPAVQADFTVPASSP